MRKNVHLMMLALMAVVAAVMTACTVEDNANPNPVTSNDPLQVVPVSAAEFQAKVIGGWSETERRRIKDEGTLGEIYDWTWVIGLGPDRFDIQSDSIYDFTYVDTPIDGYLSYVYTYDPSSNTISIPGHSPIEILSVSADQMATRENNFRVVYKRMTKEKLEWFWENYGVNLRDVWFR